jgi:hypothetical protein
MRGAGNRFSTSLRNCANKDGRKVQSISSEWQIFKTMRYQSFQTKDSEDVPSNLEAHLWLGPKCSVVIDTQNCVAYDSLLFGFLCDLCSVSELYENKG